MNIWLNSFGSSSRSASGGGSKQKQRTNKNIEQLQSKYTHKLIATVLGVLFFLCATHNSLALEIPDVLPPSQETWSIRHGGLDQSHVTPKISTQKKPDVAPKINAGSPPLDAHPQPATSYLRVNWDILRVREQPTTNAPVRMVLKRDDIITLLERVDSRWLKVATDTGITGFVSGEYTRAIPRAEVPMHIPILFFHHIGTPAHDDPYANLHFPVEKLEELAHFLQENNYRTIRTMDLHTIQNTDRVVVLNFDDGYDDTYTAAYPILKKYGMIATVYVISGFIGKPGYLTAAQVQELAKADWEIGSHTIDHPDLRSLTAADTKRELQESKETLTTLIGQDVTTFCYPSGKYNATTLKIAKEAGYIFARTTEPGIVTNLKKPYELPARRVLPSMGESTWQKWF